VFLHLRVRCLVVPEKGQPQKEGDNLKRVLWLSLLTMLVLAVGTLSATPVACATAPVVQVATVSNTYMTPPTGSPVIDCGPLVFSNFQAVNAGGAAVGLAFDYVSPATWDAATGTVLVSFNPFFNVPAAPGVEDIHLFFDVTANAGSMITGVDGSIGGSNSSYNEIVCSGAGGYNGSGGCTTTQLATFTIGSGEPPTAIMPVAASQSVGIYKDILTLGPGHLTGFGQTYEVTGTTPEPATFAMLGGGLVLLAFARRRKKA
jgi:hypothetical protein